METLVLACDHGGFALKETLRKFLVRKGYAVKDVGAFSRERVDYPLYASAAARLVSSGKVKRGIIICKSGIGNSIVANKLPRVRAALCYNITAARLSRQHNDSNILVLGSLFVSPALAKRMVTVWLKTPFEGGRHAKRLRQIMAIEKELIRGKKR
jgi:ribose 5-phosphate isomerase B